MIRPSLFLCLPILLCNCAGTTAPATVGDPDEGGEPEAALERFDGQREFRGEAADRQYNRWFNRAMERSETEEAWPKSY